MIQPKVVQYKTGHDFFKPENALRYTNPENAQFTKDRTLGIKPKKPLPKPLFTDETPQQFLDKLKKKEQPKKFDGKFETNITQNVRVTNNPKDVDIDIIMMKLMRNRILHKTFNSMLSKE